MKIKNKDLDVEIKKLIGFRYSLEKIITIFTDYIIDNYDRLRKEYIKELAEEYNM